MDFTVLGLDGASRNIFGRWLDDLPNLQAVISAGCSGTLTSTDPPVTNVAWTSFATGKSPAKTGVFDWVYLDRHYSSNQYRGHEVLQEALYDRIPRSGYVNLPGAYPRKPLAEEVDLIYAWDAPDKETAVPASLKDVPEYDDYIAGKHYQDMSGIEQIQQLRRIASKRFEFSKRVFERSDELFYVLFSAPDFGLHVIHELTGQLEAEYKALYEDLDEYIGWFRDRSENLMLVSDHGFEKKTREFFLLDWLAENGYLMWANTDNTSPSSSRFRDFVLGNDILFTVGKKANDALKKLGSNTLEESYREMQDREIDYSQTQALKEGGLWNIVLNRTTQFSSGCVAGEEVEPLRAELIRELSALEDPATGQPVFEYVRSAQEVHGTDHSRAPDIVANPSAGISFAGSSGRGVVYDDTSAFKHRMDGFFALEGDLFRSTSTDADIIDMFPTILHALDRDVPRDVDGSVLTTAFESSTDVTYCPPSTLTETPPTIDRRSDDDEILQQRLEDLGYVQ